MKPFLWERAKRGLIEAPEMKKLMLLVLGGMLAAVMPLMAETETVGGYTWTYRINGNAAEIQDGISPSRRVP